MSFDANTVATGSPTDTEPDKATWDFWPQAPLGDFARLLPVSPDARLGFQAAVQRMLASPQKEPWPYSARFIHWERTQLDGSDSQAILESTPETGLSSDSQSINGQPQATPPPATITGYYRLNMVDPHPPEFVWILGVGRKGRDVEFIVTTPERKSNDGVFGRHAKLKRSFDSGAIIVATDSHPVWVDGHQLARRRERDEDPAMFQRVAGSQATISLGRMTYKLQMQDLRPSVDRAQMEEAQRSLTSLGPGPSFFLTPTPTMSATLMGNYYVFEPFACGSVGTVHFVTHSVTGKPYALKRIRRRHDQDGRAIQSEIDILRTISHAHACRVIEVFTQRFERPDIRQNSFAEVCVVLDPAARRSLEEFVNPPCSDDIELPGEAHATRPIFIQCVILQLADVGAYLHGKGIMHRDYKLENIAVVRTSPEIHVVLIDFGHAIRAEQSRDHMKGTVRYLAPEVLALKHGRSSEPYSSSVDVWALGVVATELDLQRRVRSEDDALQRAEELRRRKRDSNSTLILQLLPRLLCLDAGERITMQQIVDELGQQVSATGKRKVAGESEGSGCRMKPFSRQIELDIPLE